MRIWWLVLMSRSRSDSATTGFGNSGYQSTGAGTCSFWLFPAVSWAFGWSACLQIFESWSGYVRCCLNRLGGKKVCGWWGVCD